MSEWAQLLLTILGSSTVISGVLWFSREVIKSYLLRSVSQDTERLKAELTGLNEHLKYDLQRETLKAQLMTPKKLETYSAVIEAVRKAEGATSQVVVRFGRDYKTYDQEDFEELIERLPILRGEKRRLLELLQQNRDEGIHRMEKLEQQVVIHEAKKLTQEARNLLTLSRLHLSPSVQKKAGEILTVYLKFVISSELQSRDFAKAYEEYTKQAATLNQLEEEMQAELLPMEGPRPAT